MVVPNDAQQIAARVRPVTAAKVIAVDPAKQNEPIYDLEAETQSFGPAHPINNPCMRHVGSERADPVNGGALDEERTEKPGGLRSVDRIEPLIGVDDAPEHIVSAAIALNGLNHCLETVPRPNIVQECKIPAARKPDTVIYRSANAKRRLGDDEGRESMPAGYRRNRRLTHRR
jgi:hypothetical protein